MPLREDVLSGVVLPSRAARSARAAGDFTAFTSRFDLDETADALVLYLAALLNDGLPGRQIRERLQLLDLDRRLRGRTPWLQSRDVRLFLAGLYSHSPVGDGHAHYDPLHLELVHALVDACRRPTAEQRRAHAAQLLREETGIAATQLMMLTWNQVRVRRTCLEITITSKVGRGPQTTRVHTIRSRPGEPRCPVAAVRALRSLDGGQFIFGAAGQPLDVSRVRRWLAAAGTPTPPPAQLRDPALLLLGFGAGLRTFEAMALRQGDVRQHDHGLALFIQGRRRPTYLPSAANPTHDPRTAWIDWLTLLEQRGLRSPDDLAFRATNFSVVFSKGMHPSGLNRMVQQTADAAGLSGRYVWTSLRSGLIRTAVRDALPAYRIAAQVDLASLTSVQRHEQRESLLGKDQVAARLGL